MRNYANEFDESKDTVSAACKIPEDRMRALYKAAGKIYKDTDSKSQMARALLEIESVNGVSITEKERIILALMATSIMTRNVTLIQLAESDSDTVALFTKILTMTKRNNEEKPHFNPPRFGGRLGGIN